MFYEHDYDPQPGSSHPLGATVGGDGANFSLFSRSASRVELVFFDRADDARPCGTIELDPGRHRTYHYWHAFVPGVQPGQLYGYRVHGPPVPHRNGRSWRRWIDTARDTPDDIVPWQEAPTLAGSTYRVEARSVVVLHTPLG